MKVAYAYNWCNIEKSLDIHLKKQHENTKLFPFNRKLKDSIDPNLILIDPSPLLQTEIDNIRYEFKKLLDNLKQRIINEPDDDEDVEGFVTSLNWTVIDWLIDYIDDPSLKHRLCVVELLDEIKKLHKAFMLEEKRVRNANKALEDSMDTRQEVRQKLSTCSSQGDLDQLEKKVKGLSVVNLNQNVSLIQQYSSIKIIKFRNLIR